MYSYIVHHILQQKGTFETGQEDSTEVPEELKLRLAYREAAVAILACYFPDPYRPFAEVWRDIRLDEFSSHLKSFLSLILCILISPKNLFGISADRD